MVNDSEAVLPDDVPTADFHDERIQLSWWYPRLKEHVQTPETFPLELDHSGEGMPEWDTTRARKLVGRLGREAFVRSDYKAAQNIAAGSHIAADTESAIDETIAELLAQHTMMRMPVTDRVWIRELLDLNWNLYDRHAMHPEVRAFVRDGDVVCHHPRLEWADRADEEYVDLAESRIEQDWERKIQPMAEAAATELDGEGWFSVDFVCTTDYEWYCTDVAVDALYDASERGGSREGWQNISAHPEDCEHDLEAMIE